MDIATFVGMIGALGNLMIGIGEKGSQFFDETQLLLVLGGTLAVTLIATPLRDVLNLLRIYTKTFFYRSPVPTAVIERLVGLSETARREGILALENALSDKDDPFLAQGTRLAVDGTEPDLIMDILETELQFIQERHARAQQMVGFIGTSGLIFGAISATLAVALQPESTGMAAASAVALPLCYGLIIFGLFSAPFRLKLSARSEIESLTKRLVIEGIMAIQSGDNPRIVEHKLSLFLAPKFRPSGERVESPAEPHEPVAPPPVDEAFVDEVRSFAVAEESRIVSAVRGAVARSDAEPDEKARVEELLEPATGDAFAFEDLRHLSDREIQVLLRECDQRDLVVALKGSSADLREKLLGNMSQRVRGFLHTELSYLGAVEAGEVFAVQSRIVAQVLALVRQGQLSLPGS